jgi:hypothetical protein
MERNPTDIRAQQRARQEAEDRQRAQREVEREDFRRLMSEPWGRRYVNRLLGQTGVFHSTFRTSSEMAFLEGRRDVGLRIWADIAEVCPDMIETMLNEAKEANK